MMRARLKGDINRGTFDSAISTGRIAQRHYFSVRTTRSLRMALAQNLALRIHDYATHPGVRGRNAQGLGSQVQGFLHDGASGHEEKNFVKRIDALVGKDTTFTTPPKRALMRAV
jgi:hypothetical protein